MKRAQELEAEGGYRSEPGMYHRSWLYFRLCCPFDAVLSNCFYFIFCLLLVQLYVMIYFLRHEEVWQIALRTDVHGDVLVFKIYGLCFQVCIVLWYFLGYFPTPMLTVCSA